MVKMTECLNDSYFIAIEFAPSIIFQQHSVNGCSK